MCGVLKNRTGFAYSVLSGFLKENRAAYCVVAKSIIPQRGISRPPKGDGMDAVLNRQILALTLGPSTRWVTQHRPPTPSPLRAYLCTQAATAQRSRKR